MTSAITPTDKAIHLIFDIGNKGWINFHELTKLLNCHRKTTMRYIDRLLVLSSEIKNLTVTYEHKQPWYESRLMIEYK